MQENKCSLCNSFGEDGFNFSKELTRWLNSHPDFTENYFRNHPPSRPTHHEAPSEDAFLKHRSSSISHENSGDAQVGQQRSIGRGRVNSQTRLPSMDKLPVRRISSQDFECVASRPILQTAQDGSRTFMLCSNASRSESRKNSPKSLDIFHSMDERDFIHELIRDICNDLDLSTIYFKILRNVCILLQADRASLFLVQQNTETEEKYLVSKLFDVTADSKLENLQSHCQQEQQIFVPFGVGISGSVASSGNYLNIEDAYKDDRFSALVDRMTGYRTKSILCMPIKTTDGEVVAVAQVVNKIDSSNTSSPSCQNTPGKLSSCLVGAPFTDRDVRVFKSYVDFCGISLHNAQMFRQSQLETKRIQLLLELARLIFAEQTDVHRVIDSMLVHSLALLECQACQLLLTRDKDLMHFIDSFSSVKPEDLFNDVYYLTYDEEEQHANHFTIADYTQSAAALKRFPINFDLCAHVVRTGETINIPAADECVRFGKINQDNAADCEDSCMVYSLLCMPIKTSNDSVLGICLFYNKSQSGIWHILQAASKPGSEDKSPLGIVSHSTTGLEEERESKTKHEVLHPHQETPRRFSLAKSWRGRFSMADESLFEAFAIFAGLAIANSQLLEKIMRVEAKQRIALDVLSYHATAPQAPADELAKSLIPSSRYFSLTSFNFTDFHLSDDETLKACFRMFMDLKLQEEFQIPRRVVCRWLLSVKKNYRQVTYHNWRHAFNVAQTMFAIFTKGNFRSIFGPLEQLAILIACLSHDLDHRGTNNQFQIETMSPLVELYSTSILEHHHFDQCIMILNTKGNDLLANASREDYARIIELIKTCILATDLSRYFSHLKDFRQLIRDMDTAGGIRVPVCEPCESHGSFRIRNSITMADEVIWRKSRKNRDLLVSILMTACDISAITKPWPVQKKTAELVACEFFEQGDLERYELNIEPTFMMDRSQSDKLPKMQIDFINAICMPCYESVVLVSDSLRPLLEGCQANLACWNLMEMKKEIPNDLMRMPESPKPDPVSTNLDSANNSKPLQGSSGSEAASPDLVIRNDPSQAHNDLDSKRHSPVAGDSRKEIGRPKLINRATYERLLTSQSSLTQTNNSMKNALSNTTVGAPPPTTTVASSTAQQTVSSTNSSPSSSGNSTTTTTSSSK